MPLCCQKRLFIGQWVTQPLQWLSIFVFKSFQQYPFAPSKQGNPVPNNTGVALNYQISLFLLSFGWHVYGESFNLLTGALWACWGTYCSSGGVTKPWQVAPNGPGRLEQDLVLGCCPDIQKCNGWNPRQDFCCWFQQSIITQCISQPPAARVCKVGLLSLSHNGLKAI